MKNSRKKDELYEFYSREVKQEIRDTRKYLAPIRQERYNTVRVLDRKYKFIRDYCNKTYVEMMAMVEQVQIDSIDYAMRSAFGIKVDHKRNLKEIREALTKKIKYDKEIREGEARINELKEQCVSRKLYGFITGKFNSYLMDALIKRGYTFSSGYGIGALYVIHREPKPKEDINGNIKLPINWGESLRIKEEIIKKGGVPYNKETAPHGEKWMVFHIGARFLFKWEKRKAIVKNSSLYSFRPCYSAIAKLNDYVKENEFAEINYQD